MATPDLVQAFYERIWNTGDLAAVPELLAPDFAFRGSLGVELNGQTQFVEYVRSIRAALSEYHCEIVECVTEGNRAFARMEFSGRHVGILRGRQPTGELVHWQGAALFRFDGRSIATLWVLGDLAGLDAVLQANHERVTARWRSN